MLGPVCLFAWIQTYVADVLQYDNVYLTQKKLEFELSIHECTGNVSFIINNFDIFLKIIT